MNFFIVCLLVISLASMWNIPQFCDGKERGSSKTISSTSVSKHLASEWDNYDPVRECGLNENPDIEKSNPVCAAIDFPLFRPLPSIKYDKKDENLGDDEKVEDATATKAMKQKNERLFLKNRKEINENADIKKSQASRKAVASPELSTSSFKESKRVVHHNEVPPSVEKPDKEEMCPAFNETIRSNRTLAEFDKEFEKTSFNKKTSTISIKEKKKPNKKALVNSTYPDSNQYCFAHERNKTIEEAKKKLNAQNKTILNCSSVILNITKSQNCLNESGVTDPANKTKLSVDTKKKLLCNTDKSLDKPSQISNLTNTSSVFKQVTSTREKPVGKCDKKSSKVDRKKFR